jgi:CubicO group peptidase (beta-lactamase class C family)
MWCGGASLAIIASIFAAVYTGVIPLATVAYNGSGFIAKVSCSVRYVQNRDLNMQQQMTCPDDTEIQGIMKLFTVEELSSSARVPGVRVSLLGRFFVRYAVYHPAVGCTLLSAQFDDHSTSSIQLDHPHAHTVSQLDLKPTKTRHLAYPMGDVVDKGAQAAVKSQIDQKKLDAAIRFAFEGGGCKFNTRAIIVHYKGQIVAERYAPGFNSETRQAGWSMSKSIQSALAGVLVQSGNISSTSERIQAPEWQQDPDDPRNSITLHQALQMSSGLEFGEVYAPYPPSDVVCMLGSGANTGHAGANKPLIHEPGSHWSYASGTSNMIARYLRSKCSSDAAYLQLARRQLFDACGMESFVLELDESGTIVGSSYSWATARDWLRFGLLYLNDGICDGKRVLPEGWVRATADPAAASQHQYGLHWWLAGSHPSKFPSAPEGSFYASGFESQFVLVVPKLDIVVVRLGCDRTRKFDSNTGGDMFLQLLLEAFPPVA